MVSDWNPKCSNLMLFDCKELLITMKSQFTKPPLMTDNLVEPTKHLNVSMLAYCSSKWVGPMECPPILIRFYANVERSNMVGWVYVFMLSPRLSDLGKKKQKNPQTPFQVTFSYFFSSSSPLVYDVI